jgi:hypothetical protein
VLLFGGASINLGRADAAALARPVVAHIRAGLVPASVAPPTISGVPAVGQTLTATAGSWSNGPSALGYQWQRCGAAGTACSDIAGATGQTYVLGAGDGGSTIRVAVTAKNRDGAATVVSAATAVVVSAGPAPSNVSPPSILGTAAPGQTLSAVTGSWTNAPLGFAYQWQRCDSRGSSCVDISGATSSSYTVASADTGSTIRVAVTATNAGGSATALSTQTTVVA